MISTAPSLSSKTPEKRYRGAQKLGKLEFVVLQTIWTHEEDGEGRITVSDILPDVWRDWGLAYHSTVATVCSRLADKNLLELERPKNSDDCTPMYRSVVSRNEAGTAVIVQDNEVFFVDERTAK